MVYKGFKNRLLSIIVASKKNDNIKRLKLEDITELEIMLIKVKKLKNLVFQEYGLGKQLLRKKSKFLIANNKTKRTKIPEYKNLYFFYSNQLKEQPVNLIINKTILKSVASHHWNIKIVNGEPQYEKLQ